MLTEAEEKMVAAVRELARGPFAERATAHDREGSFVADNIDDLRKIGVPGAFVPAQYGGAGFGAEALIRVVEEIAYGCGSTAVALNMHYFTADILLLAPSPATAEVLKDIGTNQACICAPGSVVSTGLDTRKSGYSAKDDGDALLVSGRGGFGSMSEGAKYMFAGGNVEVAEGQPPSIFFSTPRLDSPGVTNLKNWDALGFRGTASHDVVLENVRIPKDQALVVPAAFLEQLQAAAAALPAEVRQGRARTALSILAIWLGLAQAALDFTVDYVGERYGLLPIALPNLPPPTYRADEPWAQSGLGEIAHWVYTGRVVLYDMAASLSKPYASQDEFNRAFAHTIYQLRRMSEEVALGCMKVCGAHAYVRGRPLERIYRDLTGCIVMAWKTDLLKQQLGLGALGRPFVAGGPVGV
jgi:alkylation response protein AidB-like acyl-CoA dehydrogenase